MKTTKNRLILTFLFIFIIPVLLGIKLLYIQLWQHETLSLKAEKQTRKKEYSLTGRGIICDRNQKELAVSMDVKSVAVIPRIVGDKKLLSIQLGALLKESPSEIFNKLNNNNGFVWIKRQIDPEITDKIESLDIKGVSLITEQKRYYPQKGGILSASQHNEEKQGNLACHLLGAVNVDNKGLSGIELYYDKVKRNMNLPDNEPFNITLCLDSTLQYIAEEELAEAFLKYRPKKGFVIIQDPSTGEILALACLPSFSTDNYEFSEKDLNNPAVCESLEPGSVIKPLIVAGALSENIVNPEDVTFCENGKWNINKEVVINDHEGYGWLNLEGVLAYSSNIGMAKIGQKMGQDKVYYWIRRFGFGSLTGSCLAGEQRGILPQPRTSRWSSVTGPILSYGQGLSVTGLQLINSYSAVANGGSLLEPQVIKSIVSSRQEVLFAVKPRLIRRVLDEKTAGMVKEYMGKVVEYGTGKLAQVEGYGVAGKTGTAQKYDTVMKKYSTSRHTSYFCGFLPLDKPVLTILVAFDEPETSYWASDTACPTFAKISKKAMNYLKTTTVCLQ